MINCEEFEGICVSPGCVVGKAFVISKNQPLERDISNDEILVLEYGEPTYAVQVMNATGVICENGGRLSHICVVAMEMGIPCIAQVENITKKIIMGETIVLNATNGTITVYR